MAKSLSTEIPDKFGGAINKAALARYVTRIENLHGERKELNDTIQAVYEEARQAGFQPPILRQIVKERKLDPEVRADQYALLDAYRRSLGMLADLPLGQAAMQRAETEISTNGATRPKPAKKFADQPVGRRPRGRPRKNPVDLVAQARAHLDGNETPPLS
jgi:uncharacterized protein (UPF0335 family)